MTIEFYNSTPFMITCKSREGRAIEIFRGDLWKEKYLQYFEFSTSDVLRQMLTLRRAPKASKSC